VAKTTAEDLKKKYTTKEAFIKAAKTVNNTMMKGIQANPKLIEDAAKELYGK
jgi:phosphopantetheinyl transferase (holo-ACP synthase)